MYIYVFRWTLINGLKFFSSPLSLTFELSFRECLQNVLTSHDKIPIQRYNISDKSKTKNAENLRETARKRQRAPKEEGDWGEHFLCLIRPMDF